MLKRAIWDVLSAWKAQKNHKPLVIRGIRQCGKTFLVKAFAKANYENVIYLDFRHEEKARDIFEGDFKIDFLITQISAYQPSARFIPGKTVLIFDELQDCSKARSSLRYWKEDGRFDVIGTGSYLGLSGYRDEKKRGVPVGSETNVIMHPLNFEEFLWALGLQEDVLGYLQDCFSKRIPLSPAVHEKMLTYFSLYLLVGGMPEAVNTYLESKNVALVRTVQKDLLRGLEDDFGLYYNEEGEQLMDDQLRINARAILDSLPAQLSKEYKRFSLSSVACHGDNSEKRSAIHYLENTGLVKAVCNLSTLSSPLSGEALPNEFKLYYADTGLFMGQLKDEDAFDVLQGRWGQYKGAVYENLVADSFFKQDYPLYYYHRNDGFELDFVCSYLHKLTLLEVKAKDGRAKSMRQTLEKNPSFQGLKLSMMNIGYDGRITSIPYYLTYLIKKDDLSEAFFPSDDLDALKEAVEEAKKESLKKQN
jgi:predicted AAA+ superfamily ATPase